MEMTQKNSRIALVSVVICNENLTQLHVTKAKIYSFFILNKILLIIIVFKIIFTNYCFKLLLLLIFNKKCKVINIIMISL